MPSYVLKRINGTRDVMNGSFVGSLPYDGNGTILGGNNGSYFKLPQSYPLANANTWEFKFNLLNIKQGGGVALLVGAENNHGFFILANYQYMGIYLSSNDTSWDIANNTNTGLPMAVGGSYYFKIGYDGTKYYTAYSTDDTSYTTTWTLTTTKKITGSDIGTLLGYGYITNNYWANGTVDLRKCSLTVDGQVVWTGMKQVPKVDDYVLKRKTSKYYKDIVTTKYWKEVETTTIGYACYHSFGLYGYIKMPLGSDTTCYFGKNNSPATSVDDLEIDSRYTWTDITETSAVASGAYPTPCTRQTEHDLYTTTTIAVESTPDDYTYTTTETTTVEGTPEDYDRVEVESDKAYVLNRIKYRAVPNVTVVGNPTIVNNVASGFSTANYLTLPELFRPENSPWERVICFTTGSNVSNAQMLNYINLASSSVSGAFLSVYASKIYMSLSSNGSSWNIVNDSVGTTTIQPNTTYFIKLRFTGSEYQKWLSMTGKFNGEETLENTVVSSTPIYQANSEKDRLGARVDAQVFTGSIDLSKCYGTINNELWWSGTKLEKY